MKIGARIKWDDSSLNEGGKSAKTEYLPENESGFHEYAC